MSFNLQYADNSKPQRHPDRGGAIAELNSLGFRRNPMRPGQWTDGEHTASILVDDEGHYAMITGRC